MSDNTENTPTEPLMAFHAALAAAQSEIEGAAKDSDNPHYKSKYADLQSVWAACRAALTKNGLAVMQFPAVIVGERGLLVEVETIITHAGGHRESFVLGIPCAKADAHGIGSAITYGRRYALAAAVGVAPEDDDGNAAVAAGAADGAPQGRGRKLAQSAPAVADEKITKFIAEANAMLDMKPTKEGLVAWEGAHSSHLKRLRSAYKGREDVKALDARINAVYDAPDGVGAAEPGAE